MSLPTSGRRRAVAVVSVISTALVAAALAGASTLRESAKPNPPIAKLIAQSKRESGLVVYGNAPAANFKVVTDAFRKKYPWISVTSYDLDNNVIFSKYASEAAQGSRTADLLVSSAPNLWTSSPAASRSTPDSSSNTRASSSSRPIRRSSSTTGGCSGARCRRNCRRSRATPGPTTR